jgi:hypothetical protein
MSRSIALLCNLRAPAALPLGMTGYPLYRRRGGSQGRSGRGRKSLRHRDSIPGLPSPWRVAISAKVTYVSLLISFDPGALPWLQALLAPLRNPQVGRECNVIRHCQKAIMTGLLDVVPTAMNGALWQHWVFVGPAGGRCWLDCKQFSEPHTK